MYRSPSPSRLSANTVTVKATPGAIIVHGVWLALDRISLHNPADASVLANVVDSHCARIASQHVRCEHGSVTARDVRTQGSLNLIEIKGMRCT